jgi:hypothetical protein
LKAESLIRRLVWRNNSVINDSSEITNADWHGFDFLFLHPCFIDLEDSRIFPLQTLAFYFQVVQEDPSLITSHLFFTRV